MDARHLMWMLCAALTLGTGCQRSQRGLGAADSSGGDATHGEAACAREPGEPPAVGDGSAATVQHPCAPAGSTNGEVSKRPDEL